MTGFLDQTGPRWFTIPAHRSFVADLASGLYQALGQGDPAALSQAIVMTPTRRGARALTEAFVVAAGGQAVLLPQIRAIGDLEAGEPPFEPGDLVLDLPPAVSAQRRRFELARLVMDHQYLIARELDATGALDLADALAGFFDSAQIEEVADLANLDALVQGDLARHWQASAQFLKIAVEAWPERLRKLGLSDLTQRRVAVLKALGQRWRDDPPKGVLVAAGSTGTAPAAAELLLAIALAPQGAVILPGLDLSLAQAAWTDVGENHPQGAMKRLLDRAGIDRAAVQVWPGSGDETHQAKGRWRRRLINEALRPAEATADWRQQILDLRAEGAGDGLDPIAEGLAGLSLIKARTEEEAATIAALLLREVLEHPNQTAALVTPDQALARRVQARLSRWGLEADSSAGEPLTGFAVGILAALTARLAAERLDPVRLLAVIKSPLVRLGLDPDRLDHARRDLERYGLRGARPASWQALDHRLDQAKARFAKANETRRMEDIEAAKDLLARLGGALDLAGLVFDAGPVPVAVAIRGLILAMEALTCAATGLDGSVWAGAAGEAAGALFANLLTDADGLPPVSPDQAAQLIERILDDTLVRTGGATHPRLRILGAIEARLVRADRLILAGLEEGVWPQAAPTDPFLSRPMRKALGLPPPERRIGLSAHDFAQAACAGEVILLHSERRGGAPSVASRWLWRLETLVKGAGQTMPERPEVLAWARAIDAPIEPFSPAPRPMPTPPLAARPRQLAVTQVERLIRDPYALYARKILNLRRLDRPDETVDARARGTAIHAAFEQFFLKYGMTLPDDAEAVFEAGLVQALIDAGVSTAQMTRERALAANIAPWVIEFERRRRSGNPRFFVEASGQTQFQTALGTFTLTAKADRIEVKAHTAEVLDFKTGAPPSKKQVEIGLAPQLTLTGAILAAGGFEGIGKVTPSALTYVRVSGGRKPGEEISALTAKIDAFAQSEHALDQLKGLVARYDNPSKAYPSWATPQFIGQIDGDYDHLARLWEWHVIGADGDESDGDEAGEGGSEA
jgi:ATP-dependent helicase/nuclease subunit B